MKNILRFGLCVSAFSLLAACGGPKIDGKNSTTFQKSVEAIRADLNQEESAQFSADLATITQDMMVKSTPDMSNGTVNLQSIQNSVQGMESKLLNDLDGKSAKDVHKEAESIRSKN